jgi:hypothetical protein
MEAQFDMKAKILVLMNTILLGGQKMRRPSFFLAIVLVITSSCVVLGQEITNAGIVSIDAVTNTKSVDSLIAGSTHQVSIRYNLLACKDTMFYFETVGIPIFWIGSNGFEVYSPEGANWVSLAGTLGPLVTSKVNGLSKLKKHFFYNGTSWAQTSGAGNTAVGPSTGPTTRAGYYVATVSADGTDGYRGAVENDIAVYLTFHTLIEDAGKTMCIDTCTAITAWEWAFASDRDFPVWDNGKGAVGPRCFTIVDTTTQDVKPIETGGLPTSYDLSQNYPNPFNPETTFEFALPKVSQVELTIFNVLGQKVVTLVSKELPAGTYQETWNGTSENGNAVSSGIYFYRLTAGDFITTKKMMMLK